MNHRQVFLVVVAAILTSCNILATPIDSKTKASPASSDVTGHGPSIVATIERRVLRSRTTDGVNESGKSSPKDFDSERAWMSALEAKLASLKAKKALHKQRTENKRDIENVIKAFGVQGLTGANLKSHPYYPKLFSYKSRERILRTWLNSGDETSKVWSRLGLTRYSADQVKNALEFKVYLRYMEMFDNKVWSRRFLPTRFQPEIVHVGHPGEMSAKVMVWAAAGRPAWYVKKMLDLPKRAVKTDGYQNYKFYEEYLKLVKKSE